MIREGDSDDLGGKTELYIELKSTSKSKSKSKSKSDVRDELVVAVAVVMLVFASDGEDSSLISFSIKIDFR